MAMYKYYMTEKTKGANINKTELGFSEDWGEIYRVFVGVAEALQLLGYKVNRWNDEEGHYFSFQREPEIEVLISLVQE